MATVKKLKLKLKSGLLSDLQSDTIFGHFAWRFKEYFDDEKIEKFLGLFENNNPVFTISDGFFENDNGTVFFPKPLKITPAKFNANNKSERVIQFLKQKENKSRKLITLNELNLYLQGKMDDFEKSIKENANIKFPSFASDLRVSVEIDRGSLKSKEGQLFSYHPKFLDDKTYIVVFVKILNNDDWENYSCEEILKDVFEIGYGKKKSSGYGQFEVINFDDFISFEEVENPNGFITLSHYLPAKTDQIKDAYYEINVKYGKFGEEKSNSHNPFKKPLLLMKPGSCFITDVKMDFYGRVINASDYLPKTIQNGIAFSLNCKFT